MPTCKLPGCENKIAYSIRGGRPKLFCCDKHRHQFKNAKIKIALEQEKRAEREAQAQIVAVKHIHVSKPKQSAGERRRKLELSLFSARKNELRRCSYFDTCLKIAALRMLPHIPCSVCLPIQLFWQYPHIIKYDVMD